MAAAAALASRNQAALAQLRSADGATLARHVIADVSTGLVQLPRQFVRLLPSLLLTPHLLHGTALQLESHVAALSSLLQWPATQLCPAAATAATDAALSLLSGLKAARLQLPASEEASQLAGALERCQQQLLESLNQASVPPTPLPTAAPPRALAAAQRHAPAAQQRSVGQQRGSELARLVLSLGCTAADWHGAQAELAQRTAWALQAQPAGSSSPAVAPFPAAGSPPERDHTPSAGRVPSTLDQLLVSAVETAAWQPCSGQRSVLHATVQELLWVVRQFPPPPTAAPPGVAAAAAAGASVAAAALAAGGVGLLGQRPQQLGLSPEGWAAYWMLEPMVGYFSAHVLLPPCYLSC